MDNIKKITKEQTYPVRNNILRKGKPVESCHFPGDDSETTFHFGYHHNEQIIGIVSLFQTTNKIFDNSIQFQIRGMAIQENHQKKGIGKALIEYLEQFLKPHHQVLLWFNARESAVPFYKKLGYEIKGEAFEIEEIGTHYIMYKTI